MDWIATIVLVLIIGGMGVGMWMFSKTDKSIVKKGGVGENHPGPSILKNKGKPDQYIIPIKETNQGA